MQRTDFTDADGTWAGLSLDVRDRPAPGLCVFSADSRILLTQASRPVLFAAVEGLEGVDFWRTDAYRSVLPPLRADTARAVAGDPARWAHRFAHHLADPSESPLHDGRWLLTPDCPLPRRRPAVLSHREYWSDLLAEGHPDGYLDWYAHSGSWEVVPLRPMPGADDSRVKAYRKQAREGTLPPVLLWWVSGLDSHLVLDGHARLAAAVAESVEPPLLQLHRTTPPDDRAARTEEAVTAYQDTLTRFANLRTLHGPAVPDGATPAGAELARRLHTLDTAERPTWSWPLPGGTPRWTELATRATAGRPWPP
ncbi:hypothetical protein ACIA8O_16475 [Kitasatospora sp. NPDC051853]|uniref:hypothetical protein n=1 Tax=Kitasatospora sp. NPDC051853 TaxID=3364058 RepID=UPI0037A85B4A